jgi:hypothetical protein
VDRVEGAAIVNRLRYEFDAFQALAFLKAHTELEGLRTALWNEVTAANPPAFDGRAVSFLDPEKIAAELKTIYHRFEHSQCGGEHDTLVLRRYFTRLGKSVLAKVPWSLLDSLHVRPVPTQALVRLGVCLTVANIRPQMPLGLPRQLREGLAVIDVTGRLVEELQQHLSASAENGSEASSDTSLTENAVRFVITWLNTEDWEASIPPLDLNSADWVRAGSPEMEPEKVTIKSLAAMRRAVKKGALRNSDLTAGIDKTGRKWRKPFKGSQHVYYLRTSLRSYSMPAS